MITAFSTGPMISLRIEPHTDRRLMDADDSIDTGHGILRSAWRYIGNL